ncbi:hypothetical protein [Pseudomonas sp. Irchel 3A5]|uniref:hypothetical protein n=1 Tax=Pseudomonas sp. Irchel 3A5 TaxID=2008911 RepID=UPI0021148EA5|nr:hypothetical protein [Pseudomonas sp. Irchel 3A5]
MATRARQLQEAVTRMTEWDICETQHWQVSHRRHARYVGYLMVSSIAASPDFMDLSDSALASLEDAILFLSREDCEWPLNNEESEAQHTTVMNLRNLYAKRWH